MKEAGGGGEGMTDQVGGFQNPGVCLQAFPSFLPHPLPAVLDSRSSFAPKTHRYACYAAYSQKKTV